MPSYQSGLFDQTKSKANCGGWAPIISHIKRDEALQFIKRHHYAKGLHGGPMAWGDHTKDNQLRAVCAFATPCSEAVRSSVFGPEHKDRVTELHRLAVAPGKPDNFTSWFVARCLDRLLDYRPHIRGIISFADSTEGHDGAIYRALNFHFCGMTGQSTFYRDESGKLRHPRQNGTNITPHQAINKGWVPESRDSKFRYILIIGPDKREKRKWTKALKVEPVDFEPYNTAKDNAND